MKPVLSTRTGGNRYHPGIEVADGFLANPPSGSANAQNTSSPNTRSSPTPRVLGIFDVAGFQKQEGPAFNYARTLTWMNFANNLLVAFDDAPSSHELISLGAQQTADAQVNSQQSPRGSEASLPGHNSTNGSQSHLYEYSNLDELSDAKPIFWKNVAVSTLMGVLIQWGTTMLAFILAFETVVKGLGCRSGSYLIYGVLSTAACIFLLISAALSHVTMREYERKRLAEPQRENGRENKIGPGAHISGAFAVFFRLLGWFLLVANTIWLLLISIWELIGFFDSCYCASTELSKKEAGWILLFKGTDALKEDAQAAWGVGIGLGFVLIFVAIAVFYLASRHKHE
ncbi:hypothetical protein CGCS363_v013483 [Colletotrichum siamense]|uniref:uncharacterized protein n=1 Tax=Colletotrichum siamense TaxID=690259 RepID=UPI001872DA01|nr:uncharacterized protein CGCS363_v013483 [Colletotrichum siamense]KAF5487012.1 hypothetical protein CGCS363_v013483 [Colletotrichum siamense]